MQEITPKLREALEALDEAIEQAKRSERNRNELGALASRIAAEMRRPAAFLDDPITVASSCGEELVGAVHQGAATAIAAELSKAGMTAAQFDAELAARTSSRWAYEFGSVEGFLEAVGR